MDYVMIILYLAVGIDDSWTQISMEKIDFETFILCESAKIEVMEIAPNRILANCIKRGEHKHE